VDAYSMAMDADRMMQNKRLQELTTVFSVYE
jgi:hypothetical protein